jgi:hypothetical protein
MRRRKSSKRRAGWLAAAVAGAAALAAAGIRLAKRGASPSPSPRDDRPVEPSPAAAETTYICGECGAEYRVSGTDRHRIYWPAGAPEDEPVMGDRCVSCDAPLPTTPQTPAARTGGGA